MFYNVPYNIAILFAEVIAPTSYQQNVGQKTKNNKTLTRQMVTHMRKN